MSSRTKGRRQHRHHLVPLAASCLIGASALAMIVYLLWPTWTLERAGDPDRLPMMIGDTLFNVPTGSVRVKLQKRTGPQERVDLAFMYPSLVAPEAVSAQNITAETIEADMPPIDRIFLSIAAHHDALSPDERVRTIYPRYWDANATHLDGGLNLRAFRDNTPYTGEDLVFDDSSTFVARCTRDEKTPGMCLSARRIDGADLNFRFPRAWLAQWRDVASAMERLVAWMRGTRN
ncbi:MAG: hypothetical protein K2X60_05805 [Xanthobacteraceae bacterium]|nr:hypothetical protein [Xanthobacteraceae bacterium]